MINPLLIAHKLAFEVTREELSLVLVVCPNGFELSCIRSGADMVGKLRGTGYPYRKIGFEEATEYNLGIGFENGMEAYLLLDEVRFYKENYEDLHRLLLRYLMSVSLAEKTALHSEIAQMSGCDIKYIERVIQATLKFFVSNSLNQYDSVEPYIFQWLEKRHRFPLTLGVLRLAEVTALAKF